MLQRAGDWAGVFGPIAGGRIQLFDGPSHTAVPATKASGNSQRSQGLMPDLPLPRRRGAQLLPSGSPQAPQTDRPPRLRSCLSNELWQRGQGRGMTNDPIKTSRQQLWQPLA